MTPEQILSAARQKAVKAPVSSLESRDWPSADDVDLETAIALLAAEGFMNGAKLSGGPTTDGTGFWVRLAYPKWSPVRELAGMTAFTAAGDLGKALRKACQLPPEAGNDKVWKPNPFEK